jgi:hypothetical protein
MLYFYSKVLYHLFYHVYSKQPPQMWYFIHPQKPPPEKVVNFLIYTLCYFLFSFFIHVAFDIDLTLGAAPLFKVLRYSLKCFEIIRFIRFNVRNSLF